jgi:superfamily II DNA or RNA helicase
MQPESNVSKMQPEEKKEARWAWRGLLRTYRSFKPRRGQDESYEMATTWNDDGEGRLVTLPTAYGKTKAALGVYLVLRERGVVNRCLVFTSSALQRRQFSRESLNLCRKHFKASICGVSEIDDLSDSKLANIHPEPSRNPDKVIAEIFVTTYQKAICHIGKFMEIWRDNKLLVICDEVHHLPDDGKWAEVVDNLPAERRLYLSATPVRYDRKRLKNVPTYKEGEFEYHKAVVDIPLKYAAIQEGAIRRPLATICNYEIALIGQDGKRIVVLAEDLLASPTLLEDADEGAIGSSGKSKRRARMRHGLRYDAAYRNEIIERACARLKEKNSRNPNQHQMLVFCMGQDHAIGVNEQIRQLKGNGYSDWIGERRTDKENEDVVDRYISGNLPCLVQVNKAAEGFDNPRTSVIVFLNMTESEPRIIQQLGRGLRRNNKIPGVDDSMCDVFAGADTPVAKIVQKLEIECRELAMILGEDEDEEDEGYATGIDYDDRPSSRGTGLEGVMGMDMEVTPIGAKSYLGGELGVLSNENIEYHRQVEQVFREFGVPAIPLEAAMRIRGLSREGERERSAVDDNDGDESRLQYTVEEQKSQIAEKIEMGLRVFTGVFLDNFEAQFNGAEKPEPGEIKRSCNTEFRRLIAARRGKKLSVEQLRGKLNWIRDGIEKMRDTGEVPRWVMIVVRKFRGWDEKKSGQRRGR